MVVMHELKIFEDRCGELESGARKSEVRKSDRDFKEGDLIRFVPGYHMHGEFRASDLHLPFTAMITNIDRFGVQEGYINLSVELLK